MSILPEWHNGMRRWVAPEVKEIMDKLHGGDPTCGWEGDPYLDLYMNDRNQWVLCRHEPWGIDEIMVSKPGVRLDNRIIQMLVTHDTQRGYNVVDEVMAQNATILKQRENEAQERTAEATSRLQFALRKDIGQTF
jgi:hypothetical protein